MTSKTSTGRPVNGEHMPLIHLNGSGRKALLDEYEATYRALSAAYDVLCDAAPNGRDYYPIGPDALSRATAEFRRRLDILDDLRKDVMADWEELAYPQE